MRPESKSARELGGRGASETGADRATFMVEDASANVKARQVDAATGDRAKALAAELASGTEQSGGPRPGEAHPSEYRPGSDPRSREEAQRELAAYLARELVQAAPPRPQPCGYCGAEDSLHFDADGPIRWWCSSDLCLGEWRTDADYLAACEARDREAWHALPAFVRFVVAEPETEAALRRVARPLVRLAKSIGADADVLLTVLLAVNGMRSRPAPDAKVEQIAVEVAHEVNARQGANS